jgi:hypothetical protein
VAPARERRPRARDAAPARGAGPRRGERRPDLTALRTPALARRRRALCHLRARPHRGSGGEEPQPGIYRMVFDARTTGMRGEIGKGGGFHYHCAERAHRPSGRGRDRLDPRIALAVAPEGIDDWPSPASCAAPRRASPARARLTMRRPRRRRVRARGIVPPRERRRGRSATTSGTTRTSRPSRCST